MVDLGSLVLLMSIFGWKVAVIYVVLGLVIAVAGGGLIEKLHLENQVEEYIRNGRSLDVPQEALQTLCMELPLQNPPLWSMDAPNLLTCQISLENAAEADRQRLHFGVRDLQWSADRGLILNGVETPIRGICCHQDHAGVGVAVPRAVTEYRVRLLKEMGCNAYRCAHHCPSQDLLDACDRQGMLVMVENRHFSTAEEVLRQVDSMVLYSRNHPCVFLYSAFNEEFWARESRGARMTRTLARRIRALDPTRAITGAIHMDGSSLTPENASDASRQRSASTFSTVATVWRP